MFTFLCMIQALEAVCMSLHTGSGRARRGGHRGGPGGRARRGARRGAGRVPGRAAALGPRAARPRGRRGRAGARALPGGVPFHAGLAPCRSPPLRRLVMAPRKNRQACGCQVQHAPPQLVMRICKALRQHLGRARCLVWLLHEREHARDRQSLALLVKWPCVRHASQGSRHHWTPCAPGCRCPGAWRGGALVCRAAAGGGRAAQRAAGPQRQDARGRAPAAARGRRADARAGAISTTVNDRI